MALRVVLLTKPYPLATLLQQRLAATGFLVGVIHEQSGLSCRRAGRALRRLVKQRGVGRAVDVLAYQVYQRLFRARELRRRFDALPTPHADAASPDVALRTFPTLNSPEARAAIRDLAPDLIVVHATGILKPETFGLAPLAVNLHCGVLPEYRGHDSTFWALVADDFGRVGATLHVIDAGVDTGTVIAQRRVSCGPGANDFDAWVSSFVAGVDLAVSLVEQLARGAPLTFEAPSGPPTSKHYPRKGLTDYVAFERRRRRAANRLLPFAG
jgi:methionyl-tRNA formyltransferase